MLRPGLPWNKRAEKRSNMPRFAIPFVIGAISTVFLHAQGPPTFRVGTTLIEFTLVALDSRGNPVTDLTKEDLVLTEGTRTRDIAFFRFDGDMPAVSTPTQAVPAGFVTNRPEPERNAVALVPIN
jgi:hypothetical protein